MCENIFPEQIINAQSKSLLSVSSDPLKACIEPGNTDTAMEAARDQLSKLNFPESVKSDLLYWCHSCAWWFWWHIFLIVLGLVAFIGMLGLVKLCICDKQKRVKVSKAAPSGDNNGSYEMDD